MKCLILGYGYMGRIRHAVLRDHPDVTDIKIYDPCLAEVPANIQQLLLPKGEDIPWGAFDAVFVCTPNNVTARLCIEALKYCKNVFCEKPPGRNYEEVCAIEEAFNSTNGSRLVFGFNHRLHPAVKTAMALVGEGGLGDIIYLKGTYGKSGGSRYKESWRNNQEISGGGVLLDQGIHMLDLFQQFLGPLNLVESVLRDAFWKCSVEDNAFVLLKSEKGVPAFLHSSATLWKHTFHMEIGCRDGYLVISGLLSKTGSYGREQLLIGRRQFENEAMALGNPREEIIYFDRDDSWRLEIEDFLSAIKENRKPTHGTLEEAKQVMKLVRDVYASSKLG